MGTFIFHNKYHRNAHHTIASSGFPDSASDPIASEKYPFLGVFYNSISAGISANSLDWFNTFTAVTANSAIWNNYLSVLTTVSSNSAFWQNNQSVYITYNSLSANLNSTFTTVSQNSAFWNRLYSEETLKINKVQQDTRQKTFAALEIIPNDISNIILDLSAGQVSYYVMTSTSNISGFVGAKMGGKYVFYTTAGNCLSTITLNFNPEYFRFPSTNSFAITGTRLGKFEFLFDGAFLHGKSVIFNSIAFNDENTFFSGSGITINPNPYIFSINEAVQPLEGLLVNGVYPYTAGTGILILSAAPCSIP